MAIGAELERLPKIMLKGVPMGFGSFGEIGKAIARADPRVKLASSFAQVADKLYMSDEHCLMYLARRVSNAEQAQARSGWFGGRLYNRMAGENADFVELSGAVLAGAMRYSGHTVPEGLDRGQDYLLRRDYAQGLLLLFKDKAKRSGMIA
ncbi:hypothetical protein ACMU_11815 [Actibacterium mucosum KCTC 23349]|uniref:Uncharacterized protein n=1 Tax=Actibacterium mucosum KCTC 23349 TaxID=1454373 RepID=A0A037ZFY9_9RHOB|nr:hypothetical protein [Actibacterium mucosum]KAJ55375.1 hypothetical protein ACMU_11815 [Actibacterium mucosum KCTC 23349]